MGIFNTFFASHKKSSTNTFKVNWIPLQDMAQVKEIKQLSEKEPVLIFKHSTRCGISRMVIREFENGLTDGMKTLKMYYLDLLNYRAISNEVSDVFQVAHESPQVLVVKNGVAAANASHYSINGLDMEKYIS